MSAFTPVRSRRKGEGAEVQVELHQHGGVTMSFKGRNDRLLNGQFLTPAPDPCQVPDGVARLTVGNHPVVTGGLITQPGARCSLSLSTASVVSQGVIAFDATMWRLSAQK